MPGRWRVRIARDLHDVVAHHISVINVQSGVVRHLLDSDPVQARAANTIVREASQVVLSELSAILGLLRTSEDRTDTHPAPSLSQTEALVESMRYAGVLVSWEVIGTPVPLPPLIDLTAYRIILGLPRRSGGAWEFRAPAWNEGAGRRSAGC